MQQWQSLLINGNDFFKQQNWLKAQSHYQKAETLLDDAWHNDSSNLDLLMAWICANHNLAALYEKQAEYTVALQYLVQAHQRLAALIQADYLPNKLKLTVIKMLKITWSPIIEFKKSHPICDNCMAALSRTSEQDNKQTTQLN